MQTFVFFVSKYALLRDCLGFKHANARVIFFGRAFIALVYNSSIYFKIYSVKALKFHILSINVDI